MNNSDFQRLLLTNDKELISELTKAPKGKRGKQREEGKSKGKGGGKGTAGKEGKAVGKGKKTKGAGKGNAGAEDTLPQGQEAGDAAYRDRAQERRELKGEYERVAAEWENHGEVTVDESKYLGGDLEHTHLVKGLDYALLTKVRTELTKHQKAEEAQKARSERKAHKQRMFQTTLGRKVWNTVVETLHPHHTTFQQRMEKMGRAISMGQRIRGALTVFLPGRMAYEFDTSVSQAPSDIPRIVYTSKEDAPAVDGSRKVASVLPEMVTRVREALQRAAEGRRQRKRDRTAGTEPSYAVAQKLPAKHKAQDLENDIFLGAGGFDTTELARKSKPASGAPPSALSPQAPVRTSYFDDAGSERYTRPPEGQIDPQDLEVEEGEGGRGASGDPGAVSACAFEAAERFLGPRRGWAFKLGPQGLGYYSEAGAATAVAAAAAVGGAGPSEARRPLRRAAPARSAADVEDAYGECFPDAGLGHALVQTGAGDSDEEAAEEGKKKRKPDATGDGLAANQKRAAADGKKRKQTEAQEWQKIDNMIKKGRHGSLEELEAYASRPKRNQPPVPREITSTPAYF
mmetsp:Transcript_61673/g.198692  ORF Transcript_61673/g.198692 Transcript_61673/m.198692 type:complete len:571 (-) Transcript_61673:191-1903(-)